MLKGWLMVPRSVAVKRRKWARSVEKKVLPRLLSTDFNYS